MPSAIEDYALIGDCESAALVARNGSIDWLCLPRFDSDACFAALVGKPENGRWQICPRARSHVRRCYREGTLILETQFENDEGMATLIDFMPLRKANPQIIRIVRGERGNVHMHMDLVMRFDYGETVPWVTRAEDGSLVAIAGPHRLVLRSSAPFRGEGWHTVSDFKIKAGTTAHFELQYGSSFHRVPIRANPESLLKKTESSWRTWISRCKYVGPYSDVVERSLITLKALTYAPTGGILAAPTTSLPERPRGTRNWDYRYCWLRDATFTLLALMHAGYYSEARRWKNWLTRSIAGAPDQIQVLYGVAGERHLAEWEIPSLQGYHGAVPVRVGNAASVQFQLDIFGEVTDVLHQAMRRAKAASESEVSLQVGLLEYLEKIWHHPDHGIWETRGRKKQFTHSKAMAWVAFDRGIRIAEQLRLKAPLKRWRAIRQRIHDEVCRRGFNRSLQSFVQSYGSNKVDANLLLLPLVGFLSPSDQRVAGTVRRVEQVLLRDGFVLRYDTRDGQDGLPAGEGAFLPCSFWLADNYELMGRHAEAEKLLKRLLDLRNDVGLLSEEYNLRDGRFAGNFPQAFSHVAMVNTIINLYTRRGPAHQRSNAHLRRHSVAS
ncbi:MAG TPA: glycoside hydrolase family 15 protein [Verrucomicrobiae bacterium]|nr:glycoside hydrolase family 15 protein [Verrucomicrobiae bacterium]